MLRDLVGEGAANAAIVPVLTEYQTTKGEDEFQACFAHSLKYLLLEPSYFDRHRDSFLRQ